MTDGSEDPETQVSSVPKNDSPIIVSRGPRGEGEGIDGIKQMQSYSALSSPTTPKLLTKQVFVAYSYRLYPKDDYRKVYKELAHKYDVTFIFADEKITNMHIMKKIETLIRGADFSIFDISGWNPNVTLELGYAMAIGDNWYIAIDPSKTVINEVPSDLRGLDRIQYSSYTELGTSLTVLMEQWYPLRKPASITEFIDERKAQVIELLRRSPGQTMGTIKTVLGVSTDVAQLVVRAMIGAEVETRGTHKGKRYYLRASTSPKT